MAINLDHKNNLIVTNDSLLDFQMTGSVRLPTGTTAQRPISPVNGMIRYSTSINNFEGFINGAWAPIGSGGGSGGAMAGYDSTVAPDTTAVVNIRTEDSGSADTDRSDNSGATWGDLA